MDGQNYVVFHNAADDSYMNTTANFRGAYAATQTVDIYFESPLSTSGGASGTAYDKITVVCTDGEEDRAVEQLAGAMVGSGPKGRITVIADDVNNVYACQDITAVTTISTATSGVTSRIESLSAVRTVTAADSGTTFVLNAAAGLAITLSAASSLGAGFKCKFVTGTLFATSDWVITATAAVMRGVIAEATGAATQSTIAGTTATFELGADSLGDYVELECDGTHIFINGMSVLADSITLA